MKRIYNEERSMDNEEGIELEVFAPVRDEADEEHYFPCFIFFRVWKGWDKTDCYRNYLPDKWIVSFHQENQAIREAIKLIDEEAVKRWG